MKKKLILSGLIAASFLTTAVQASSLATQVKPNYVKSDYAKTKYPLVFAHGMSGFSRLGTDQIGLDYWYQILPDLAQNGANAWATRVSPFNSTEVRGEQLLQQVQDILAITGQAKVNLIGHSHGGPTIRYVGSIIPDKVASLTTIASPNKGSPVADFVLKAEGTILESPIVAALNLLSQGIVWAQAQDQNTLPSDSLAAGKSLTTAGSLVFTQKFPMGVPSGCTDGPAQENGISLYSFMGNRQYTNFLDLDSPAMAATGLLINEASDGLVSLCSGKFGKVIRDNYAWNHFDEVNQVFGLRDWFSQDPVQVYREHANRLKLAGL